MKKIYIAGPFRGRTPWHVAQNVRDAETVAIGIAEWYGAVPVCPHAMYQHYDKSLPDSFWLAATMELLKMCDGILMLPRWEDSEGAKAELLYAYCHGIRVFEHGDKSSMLMLREFCK